MIYNIFPFFNELELLKIRLKELSGVVDRFVLIEANRTHRGDEKPLYFKDNESVFSPWAPKIKAYAVLDMPFYPGDRDDIKATWRREYHQRDCARRILPKLANDDVAIYTDADEIPRASVIADYAVSKGALRLDMRWYHFWLNAQFDAAWCYAHVFPGYLYNAFMPGRLRDVDVSVGPLPYPEDGCVNDAGWHWSYLGNTRDVKIKLDNYSHWNIKHGMTAIRQIQEGSNQSMAELMAADPGSNLNKCPMDDPGLPECVHTNAAYYKNLGLMWE